MELTKEQAVEEIMQIANVFLQISSTTSRIEKEGLLRKGGQIPGFKECLKHIYNPYVTTGIKRRKLENGILYKQANPQVFSWKDVVEYYTVSRPGNDAEVQDALAFIQQSDKHTYQWFASALVTKDVQCGLSAVTVNKVFPNLIPIIGIMRGKQAPEAFNGNYIVTEKIDGNRRLFFNFADGVQTYTRSGKPATGLVQIEKEIHEYLPTGYIYDCECIAIGNFTDNIALRQASASILNSKSDNKTGVKALCFDMIKIDDYNQTANGEIAADRKATLAAYMGSSEDLRLLNKHMTDVGKIKIQSILDYRLEHTFEFITALPILGIAHNKQDAVSFAEPIWQSGGEGVMAVDTTSTYRVSTSPQNAWLKIKATIEVEAICVGVYPGEVGKKYEETLGGIIISFKAPDNQTYTCSCGSGFSDILRDYYMANPNKIIGEIVEIDCFGYSKAKDSTAYSLNCPIFKRIKGDVD